jgi:Xaa-Pro dipeptidase
MHMLLNEPRLRDLLRRNGWLGFIGTTAESVTYLSGHWAMPQWIRRGPQVYAFQGVDDSIGSFVVTGTGLSDQAADQTLWVDKVHRYGEFFVERPGDGNEPALPYAQRWAAYLDQEAHGDPVRALVFALQDAGITSGKLGLEEEGLSRKAVDQLRQACPSITFEDAGAFSLQVRAIKTADEVSRLAVAGRIAERSIHAALAGATEGESEWTMARRFHQQTVLDGGVPVLGCIGFGSRSALPNVDPSPDEPLRPGSVIRFDVGGRYAHYRADIARIAAFGDVPRQARTAHAAVQAGIEHAYSIIRPGLPASRLFDEVVSAVRKAGLPDYRRNHVGHGIGLDGYEVPALTPRSADVLQQGMVMCIETPYYALGMAGLQVEDMVVVTDTGVRSLMTLPRHLLDCPAAGNAPPLPGHAA